MELIVHGTKGGCKVFTPKRKSGLLDLTPDRSNAAAIGQQAFGIRFTAENTIFSKYKIIRDVQGGKRTGFVGFSLFINKYNKLAGNDILNILESVSEEFEPYIVDNNLNNVPADWDFLDQIIGKYNTNLDNIAIEDAENIESGEKDDSFIYFDNNFELQKYFENPLQDEYRPYRQVILINRELQNKIENPLNAIRHSGNDLTGKIDLDNPFYKLREYHKTGKNGIEIKIKNSKGRELFNKDKVYRKEEITVVYSKKYYHEKQIVGSLLNNEELRKYLVVSSDKKIDVAKEVLLNPLTKTIYFEVITKKDLARVTDAEIQLSEYQEWQKITEYTFTAEELGRDYRISARSGKFLFSEAPTNLKPIDFNESSLTLQLSEKRTLKIVATEAEGEQNNILDFTLWVSSGKCNGKTSEITFTDDEIDKTWNITVEKNGYRRTEPIAYCPRSGADTVYFVLKKDLVNREVGFGSGNEESFGEYGRGKTESFTKRIKTVLFRPASIAFLVVSAVLIGMGFWAFIHFRGVDNQTSIGKLSRTEITAYVTGDSIILNKLNTYKDNWQKQKPEIISIGDFVWYNPMTWFVGGNETFLDSTNYKEWSNTLSSIERAIELRTLLNEKDFSKLRKFHFSSYQNSIKTAVERIDNTQYTMVKKELNDVSNLTLTQIAGKINEILKPVEPEKEETSIDTKMETPQTIKKTEEQPKQEQKTVAPLAKQETASTDKTSEIIQYIKGSELKKEKLEEYKKTKGINQKLKTSIQTCLEFWELDGIKYGKESKTYYSFLEKIKSDPNFEKSKLKAFVEKMCQEDVEPSYNELDKKKGLK